MLDLDRSTQILEFLVHTHVPTGNNSVRFRLRNCERSAQRVMYCSSFFFALVPKVQSVWQVEHLCMMHIVPQSKVDSLSILVFISGDLRFYALFQLYYEDCLLQRETFQGFHKLS
jgi:hypothetical protein